ALAGLAVREIERDDVNAAVFQAFGDRQHPGVVSAGAGAGGQDEGGSGAACHQRISECRLSDVNEASATLRLLGYETRLRLLRLLARVALNVSELTAILGLAQSGVSRHLGLLRDAGLVLEQRAGTFSWYRLTPEFDAAEGPRASLWTWLRAEFARSSPATRAD